MENVFVAVVQEARRVDRLEMTADRHSPDRSTRDGDRLDPVDRVLEDEKLSQSEHELVRQHRVCRRGTDVEKKEPFGFKALDFCGPFLAPVEIGGAIGSSEIFSVTNAEIVRRRSHDQIDVVREPGHSCNAIAEPQIELRHRRELLTNFTLRLSEGALFVSSGMSDKPSKLKIADREFTSRLLVGTGKFSSNELMRDALEASGTEMVTVALRRADLSGKGDPFANILDFIDPKRFLLLPNTSGARNAEEAVRLARLAASAGLPNWVKLEIHPDPRYLLPDPVETLAAAEILVKEGFTVLPYINADPVLAKRLQDVGTATVMPLGSPIGSNRGIETRAQIEIIIEQATVPVVVDAGLGAPSQAAEAMEMGADAVLVNTAIAIASDPVRMAHAFRKAVEAGREAHEIGLAEKLSTAAATSPLTGFFAALICSGGL